MRIHFSDFERHARTPLRWIIVLMFLNCGRAAENILSHVCWSYLSHVGARFTMSIIAISQHNQRVWRRPSFHKCTHFPWQNQMTLRPRVCQHLWFGASYTFWCQRRCTTYHCYWRHNHSSQMITPLSFPSHRTNVWKMQQQLRLKQV